jgi:hypothetical protein
MQEPLCQMAGRDADEIGALSCLSHRQASAYTSCRLAGRESPHLNKTPSPDSPVRIRIASSISVTRMQALSAGSPLTECRMASTISGTSSTDVTISIFKAAGSTAVRLPSVDTTLVAPVAGALRFRNRHPEDAELRQDFL